MRRKVADMYLAEQAFIQIFLYNETVDEGNSHILHDHFLHCVDGADFNI